MESFKMQASSNILSTVQKYPEHLLFSVGGKKKQTHSGTGCD